MNEKRIRVGTFVQVPRPKSHKADEFSKNRKQFGIVCEIPKHKRFYIVQFYKPSSGEKIYKECFFWSDITPQKRPQGFVGRL